MVRAPQLGIREGRHAPIRDTQAGRPVIVKLQQVASALWSGKRQHNTHNRGVLFARDPHCHWCGLETVQPQPGAPMQPFHATLDHVYGVKSLMRNVMVLACHACNSRRSVEPKPRVRNQERRENTVKRLKEMALHQNAEATR